MSDKSNFRFTKTSVRALAYVATCLFLLGSVRQASASGFGVSLNLGETVMTFGIGDAVAVTSTPIVVNPEPATVPPVADVPVPKPRPRYVRSVVPIPVQIKKSVVPRRNPYAPVIRNQAPEQPSKPSRSNSPRDVGRARL